MASRQTYGWYFHLSVERLREVDHGIQQGVAESVHNF